MRKVLLFAVLFVFGAVSAQDYPFLSASSKPSSIGTLVDFINEQPLQKRDSIINATKYFKEDGVLVSRAYADSLSKTKDFYRYNRKLYRDTLSNSYAYVLHWRTDEEMEADGKMWKKNSEDDEKNRKKLLGSTLEELSLTDMGGNVHTLESLAGKIIVIDFWFVNCGACIEEMPELNKIRENLGTDDIAWFGVTYDKKEKVTKFLQKVKFDFDVIPESRHLVDRFGIKFFPTTLIVSPEKKIVYTGQLGPMTGRTDEIKKTLKKELKKITKKKRAVVSGPIEKTD